MSSSFDNALSEFVYKRTYAKWNADKGRRENWDETVNRTVDFLFKGKGVDAEVVEEIRKAVMVIGVLPSMRAMMCAGVPMERDNMAGYNCSFAPVDNLRVFGELLYVLMQGTGTGFSVERRFVSKLPTIQKDLGIVLPYVVGDSTEGWADAIYYTIVANHKGIYLDHDYSQVRPKGARLRTKGGRASGPEPLKRVLDFIQMTCRKAQGRRLKPLEAHDIICMEAEIVMVGGFRRASLISFSDVDDQEMAICKDFTQIDVPVYRYMANNSSFYDHKPSGDVFWREWLTLAKSGSGERGFYISSPTRVLQRGGEFRSNPCGEILLRFKESNDPWTGEGGGGQLCNLSVAVLRKDDTKESFKRKVELATILGCVQATFTNFPYVRKGWQELCEEDRLIGVDISGHCDNPALSRDTEYLQSLNRVVLETADAYAKLLGINPPAAASTGKPAGNSSQLGNFSSGFHTRYSHYYIRRVRIDGKDPLFQLIRDQGVPVHKETGQEHLPDEDVSVWVAEFPVAAPDGSLTRHDERALDQCNRYLEVMRSWCSERGHNQSATIYVRDDEWIPVGEWLWEHWDEVTGLSFLPFAKEDIKYRLTPYEEITKEQYEDMVSKFPTIDFSLLPVYETEDMGEQTQTLACVSGVCEL
jgi:ribonucleoside-triphosphate reductase (thioredoxin)